MTKIVDMGRVNEGDDTALDGTGVVKEDKPTTVEAKELLEVAHDGDNTIRNK